MGMSTTVVLLRSKDDPEYKQKLAVFRACNEANISLPKEIEEYFEDGEEEGPLEIEFEPREWRDEDACAEGYEIDIDSLPKGVKTIRFYNSW